ncbi:MAG TPA: hypothetical protein VF006_34180 [Longimicrobium sp.]
MIPRELLALPQEFLGNATTFGRYAPPAETAWKDAATRLQAVLDAFLDEEVEPEEAESESGYTWGHLCRLNKEGRLPFTDSGRIRRRNLPRKPGHNVTDDRPAHIVSIATSRLQPASSKAQVAASVLKGD